MWASRILIAYRTWHFYSKWLYENDWYASIRLTVAGIVLHILVCLEWIKYIFKAFKCGGTIWQPNFLISLKTALENTCTPKGWFEHTLKYVSYIFSLKITTHGSKIYFVGLEQGWIVCWLALDQPNDFAGKNYSNIKGWQVLPKRIFAFFFVKEGGQFKPRTEKLNHRLK